MRLPDDVGSATSLMSLASACVRVAVPVSAVAAAASFAAGWAEQTRPMSLFRILTGSTEDGTVAVVIRPTANASTKVPQLCESDCCGQSKQASPHQVNKVLSSPHGQTVFEDRKHSYPKEPPSRLNASLVRYYISSK